MKQMRLNDISNLRLNKRTGRWLEVWQPPMCSLCSRLMLTSFPVLWLTLCRSQQHTPVNGPPCVVDFNLPQRDVVECKCEVIVNGTYLKKPAAWMRSSRGWPMGRFRVPSNFFMWGVASETATLPPYGLPMQMLHFIFDRTNNTTRHYLIVE